MRHFIYLITLFLSGLCVSAQQSNRKYNLVIAFSPELKINEDLIKKQLSEQIDGFSELSDLYDFELTKAYAFSDADLDDMVNRSLRISGTATAVNNLRNVYSVWIPLADDNQIQQLSNLLSKLPKVRYTALVDAQPVEPPFDIPPITPNYIPQQTYLNADPGVNMNYAWDLGLNGQNIRIRDIEYGFNKQHEEFHQNSAIFIAPGYTLPATLGTSYTEHGTATLGIMYGDAGNYGVKGMAYGASEVILYPEYTTEYGYNRIMATSLALANSQEGDVVLYEMQTTGENSTSSSPNYVLAEYSQPIWDLTKAASDLGIIIVAAAGNGNQNLDDPAYASYMERGNSGAIVVGAGSSTLLHSRLSFSTYGSRVDLQGWGMNVISSGYGDYSKIGNDFNQQYTTFSGTSSATPIVASCVAVLQSYYHDLTGDYLSSSEMINILQTTGIPQGLGENIGPLPNMQAAIAYIQNLSRYETQTKPDFNAYPNPFEDELNIAALNNITPHMSIELYDILGQKILETTAFGQARIQTSNLPNGIYFLKVQTATISHTFKMLKK